MDFGIYTLDPAAIFDFFSSRGSGEIILNLFAVGGWIVFVFLLTYAGLHLYQEYRQSKFTHNWKWALLAVDIPALNIQTPKAVEQLFAHIAGAFDKPNVGEKFHGGYKQRYFSFEIISIEGYIQFLIWTEETFRDLVEAAVYAQYPDAEITEVEDYTKIAPNHFPDEEYDIWAADFALTQGNGLPIRTYRDFEHSISKDTVLKDPMGTFLESFSRIGPGEQMWFQIILEPISNSWKEHVIEEIKEMIGDTGGHHGGNKFVDQIVSSPMTLLEKLGDEIFSREASAPHEEAKKDEPNKIRYLTPGQSTIVEAMEEKITKVGFKTKMRGIYLARKEVFQPTRGINALLGAINQFNIPSANSIAPALTTKTSYFMKERTAMYRKNLLMKAYKKRKAKAGAHQFILNIEELATIWHFPMSHVKTPLVQKAGTKRAEPPSGLPVETINNSVISSLPEVSHEEKAEKKIYRTDSGDVFLGDELG
ncbi:MAG: hypothetical protein A2921_02420 [Candidatus Magasanikbacteria bacterium RIFCSPLOWO2_01_FULL_43_20b]|uniref:DUF8128 domain-containing protein n=1 Tax=Candidatus Magasanikbacteria bacterium RIFCSPLOWO2_12_FULL_43_12 TaxID=1798692 RepID=A0A1F6MVT6_9BACT|nr:MAG: hypothetical protein A3I93_00640 [Candidatus Magasanikbacteria bacterium RIFCSPLOWO2_02_FULL_43_22]OGH71621.1 MAG: hypothetical protein A3C74_00230 [Candidatus Magasanikbacteria bacterium RIFCSPHIGHO2_02_FULL_44_13]OGH73634.1 MAG: hypothetical protein A2921_02420 [Candidatus Magasanikbacteria bacterium RIFCSPLOWO2_01_FULL_43_20b]OGH75779.1 MAG: hypothetical protein A3G00_04595 [Candidatus Magasanikbacteria bacterium RIFCSPLOWO2_12_FULL_43_12]